MALILTEDVRFSIVGKNCMCVQSPFTYTVSSDVSQSFASRDFNSVLQKTQSKMLGTVVAMM
jgi:hypothetical protein